MPRLFPLLAAVAAPALAPAAAESGPIRRSYSSVGSSGYYNESRTFSVTGAPLPALQTESGQASFIEPVAAWSPREDDNGPGLEDPPSVAVAVTDAESGQSATFDARRQFLSARLVPISVFSRGRRRRRQ